jgi:DNA-binding transcriptional regulator YiaG
MTLQQFRENLGLSQAEFARQIDRSVVTVREWERWARSPLPESRRRICQEFGIEANELEWPGGVNWPGEDF